MTLNDLFSKLKGSSRSGNFGHRGRPGKRGGSGGGLSPLLLDKKSGLPEGDYESVFNDNNRGKALKKALSLGVPAHQIVRANGTYHVVKVGQPVFIAPKNPPPILENKPTIKGSLSGIITPTYDSNVDKRGREQVQDALNQIPAWHLGQSSGGGIHLKNIHVVGKENVNEEADKAHGQAVSGLYGAVGGFFIEGKVTVAGNAVLGTPRHITAHEVAHAIFDNRDKNAIKTKQSEYIATVKDKMADLYNKKASQSGALLMDAVTEYAKTNPAEYRCESYAAFISNPTILKAKDPEAYKIMEELFANH